MGDQFISYKAAFFDLDGTLTSAHVWQGIIDYFKAHNERQWTHRAYMSYHFPLYFFMKAGLISDERFRKPWPAHLGWYLRGYTTNGAEKVWNWVAATKVKPSWRNDTCRILNQHRERGDLVILVSGTPVPLLERLSKDIKADHVIGTSLETRDGVFTGRSSSAACIGETKVSLTQGYLRRKGIAINYQESYAYADSFSDRYMLNMVGNPVVTYPDEALRQYAIEHSWRIYPAHN